MPGMPGLSFAAARSRLERPRRDDVSWDWSDVLLVMLSWLVLAPLAVELADRLASALFRGLAPGARPAATGVLEGVAIYAVVLALIAGSAFLRRHSSWRALGWRRVRWLWIAVAVVVGVACFFVIGEIAGWVQQLLFPTQENGQVKVVRGQYGHSLAFALSTVSVIAPLAEETLFRGFVYGWMRKHLAIAPSTLLSAALFAGVHFEAVIFLPLLVLGAVLALLYEYSGSLLPGAIVHGIFNAIEIVRILG